MKSTIFTLLVFLVFAEPMLGQNYIEIEGKILDKETKEPIPFANIYNKTTKKGTLSNTDGFFRIHISEITDTVTVSSIGYIKQNIAIKADKKNYIIYLQENSLVMSEIIITPKDNWFLFELIQESKKSISKNKRKSKAYYELKSFENDKQIELIEAYYNIDVQGYRLMNMHMKAGRIALQTIRNSYFFSLESSRALTMFNLFGKNDYFPVNPLELSKSKLRKNYSLHLESKYLDGSSNDSVYIIEYKPKDTSGLFFDGKIWINKTKNQFLKVTMNSNNTLKHPFMPSVIGKISNVCINITQSFIESKGQAVFNHIDFIYKFDYSGRVNSTEVHDFSIKTQAVLYAYDYENTFFLPIFEFADDNLGEYRKILAMPYNDFFWAYNDEYRLNDSLNTNELFFKDSSSQTNEKHFRFNNRSKQGFFEHPFVSWSTDRIKFREILSDTAVNNVATLSFKADQYRISVKIYFDLNSYRDSTHIVTSTIIDPYESFYRLPMDNQTHCFVNLFFDLCEIERRELEEKLQAERKNIFRLIEIYNNFLTQYELKNNEFFKAVERGTNEKEMIKYNNRVYEKLGIDNIALFQPYTSE